MSDIDKMHSMFGRSDNFCRECCHLKPYVGGKYKCEVFGGPKPRWDLEDVACGLINREYEGNIPVYDLFQRKPKQDEMIDGQLSLPV